MGRVSAHSLAAAPQAPEVSMTTRQELYAQFDGEVPPHLLAAARDRTDAEELAHTEWQAAANKSEARYCIKRAKEQPHRFDYWRRNARHYLENHANYTRIAASIRRRLARAEVRAAA